MKKAADKFVRIFAAVLAVLSVSILLFTLVSTLFLNRTDKEWFGYKAFIVLSDSMSATDFSAGDLVFVRHVDPGTLQRGISLLLPAATTATTVIPLPTRYAP